MKTKDLLEKRGRIVADMRQITETPSGEGGDLSVEQSAKFDSLKSELENVEARIARQQVLDDVERRMSGQHIAGTGDGRLDAELRSFSLRKAILSQVPGHSEDCGKERELSGEIARRAGRAFEGIAVPMSVFEKRVEESPDNGFACCRSRLEHHQYRLHGRSIHRQIAQCIGHPPFGGEDSERADR